jgi:tetratricopeptide (TPR) repeat protein
VARFYLACLQYHLGRAEDAIRNWEAAVEASPADFRMRRALGMAYAEQGQPVEKAAAQLEKAVELKPEHVRTMNDLSAIYAKAGWFDEQLAMLERALRRTPEDDNLAEGVLTANLMTGRYAEADKVVATHKFAPRHRTYGLRDKYRYLRYGMGAEAFHAGRYEEALKLFRSALTPPASLGVDDFQFESTPRVNYYIGRALEAMGKRDEARAAYERAATGYQQLSGDQDSWNAENFHMVLALARSGNKDAGAKLEKEFEEYAKTQMESQRRQRQTQARYLLGLVKKYRGENAEARRLMEEAVKLEPDFLGPRLELRGDVVDKLGS